MPAVAHRESRSSSTGDGGGTQRQGGNSASGLGNSGEVAAAGLDAGTLLRAGSQGSAVVSLQRMLNAAGAGLAVDGIFGRLTRAAVMVFQRTHGLVMDGIVGPNTVGVLNSSASGGASSGWLGGGGSSSSESSSADSSTAESGDIETDSGSFTGDPMLKRGSRGPRVRQLQQALNEQGCPCAVDGIFGLMTHRAVRCFQREHGLRGDGIIGPRTAAVLNQAMASGPGSTHSSDSNQDSDSSTSADVQAALSGRPALERGDAGRRVRQLQELLNQYGADLYVDGEYGTLTANAVRRFQAANNLSVDGVAGPNTVQVLNSGSASELVSSLEGTYDGGEDESEIRDAVISAADSHLGAPYYWGGDGPSVFDCSGFILYVLRQDTGLVNWGDDTAHGIRNRLPRANTPQRGDPVFFSSGGRVTHVEFATGSGTETIGASGGGSSTYGNDPDAKVQYGNWNRDGRAKSFGSISGLIRDKLNRRNNS